MALKLETYYSKIIMEQKNSFPLLNQIAINLALANGSEDYYASPKSVIEYPRYLFREDIKQKWTNEKTVDNICILPNQAKVNAEMLEVVNKFKIYDFSQKAELFNSFLVYQYSYFDSVFLDAHPKKYLPAAKEHIRFFNMVVEEEFDPQEVVDVLMDIHNSEKNVEPICAVYHQDEEYNHVHFLYILDSSMTLSKKELKNIPHIENIIKERYER